MLYLSELLSQRGLRSFEKTKLVRHQDKRMDVRLLRRRGFFEWYQSTQSRDIFQRGRCERIVSFIGAEYGRAIFVGVYRVIKGHAVEVFTPPAGYPYIEFTRAGGFVYELVKEPGFEDLEDRLVIDWGDGRLAWHQWFKDKEVDEVLPHGFVMDWPSYAEVVLPYADLKSILDSPTGNREWHRRLSAVAGVYCILDQQTGKFYIGSAYGKDGIWGRWKAYADTVHGGNVVLKKACKERRDFKDHLQFSILQTLSGSTPREEVVALEAGFKAKLGSRAYGLNAN
ncbi:MAG: GIY-YIG nuclease family protein [Deltaproteobacteria bacterium]|nr:GIY-YIG nuclease family protein [Deltaproteobacteria bacterium]